MDSTAGASNKLPIQPCSELGTDMRGDIVLGSVQGDLSSASNVDKSCQQPCCITLSSGQSNSSLILKNSTVRKIYEPSQGINLQAKFPQFVQSDPNQPKFTEEKQTVKPLAAEEELQFQNVKIQEYESAENVIDGEIRQYFYSCDGDKKQNFKCPSYGFDSYHRETSVPNTSNFDLHLDAEDENEPLLEHGIQDEKQLCSISPLARHERKFTSASIGCTHLDQNQTDVSFEICQGQGIPSEEIQQNTEENYEQQLSVNDQNLTLYQSCVEASDEKCGQIGMTEQEANLETRSQVPVPGRKKRLKRVKKWLGIKSKNKDSIAGSDGHGNRAKSKGILTTVLAWLGLASSPGTRRQNSSLDPQREEKIFDVESSSSSSSCNIGLSDCDPQVTPAVKQNLSRFSTFNPSVMQKKQINMLAFPGGNYNSLVGGTENLNGIKVPGVNGSLVASKAVGKESPLFPAQRGNKQEDKYPQKCPVAIGTSSHKCPNARCQILHLESFLRRRAAFEERIQTRPGSRGPCVPCRDLNIQRRVRFSKTEILNGDQESQQTRDFASCGDYMQKLMAIGTKKPNFHTIQKDAPDRL